MWSWSHVIYSQQNCVNFTTISEKKKENSLHKSVRPKKQMFKTVTEKHGKERALVISHFNQHTCYESCANSEIYIGFYSEKYVCCFRFDSKSEKVVREGPRTQKLINQYRQTILRD